MYKITNMTQIKKWYSLVIVVMAVFAVSSCNKYLDHPPGPSDPLNLEATASIDSLKQYHTSTGSIDVINDDLIISGIVIANDESGNFYKQLFIQDSTGAMQIMIEASSLYATYPVGRRIFVKCKGMALSDYHGVMQLGVKAYVAGLPSIQGIPSTLIGDYIVGGSLNNPVRTYAVSNLSSLGTSLSNFYINNLIRLDGFEFAPTDTSFTYSDTSSYKNTTNRNVQNCSNAKTIIRTSGYANFAGVKVPQGNGSITAVYTVYGSTQQLVIRDTYDVQMNDSRCNAPKIVVAPTAVSGLTYQVGGASILEQSFTVSGTRLTSGITVTAPASFEISKTSGSGFTNTLTITGSGTIANTTIYVKLKSGLSVGTYNETITASSSGAASKTVDCAGTVTTTPSAPILNANASFSLFNYLSSNSGPSANQTITISGAYLTSNVTVTASANYEISTSPNSGFGNSVNLTVTAGNLSNTLVYVRLVGGLSIGSYTGSITVTSSGASTQTLSCNGSVTAPPAGFMTIAALRAMYTGTGLKLTGPKVIAGTVTSDISNGNITAGNVIIQDATGAIQIYFGGTLTYALGDSIVLDVTNDSLINYRSSLELKTPFGATPPTPVATGRTVTPMVKTIAEINNSLSQPLGSSLNFELMLVQIQNATIAAGTYSGNKNLTDVSGTIALYTAAAASFSGATTPSGAKNWTCHPKLYLTTKEVVLRNLNDVQ